jgi:hypothetical protein
VADGTACTIASNPHAMACKSGSCVGLDAYCTWAPGANYEVYQFNPSSNNWTLLNNLATCSCNGTTLKTSGQFGAQDFTCVACMFDASDYSYSCLK